MTYIELLQTLEQRLGYQHLPLNPRATNLKDLFESMPVHHEMMQRLAQALHSANHCRRLTDSVAQDASFDAVNIVRQETLKTGKTDVDAYRLLDDFCQILAEIFQVTPEPTAAADPKPSADILPFYTKPRRTTR